MKAWRIHSRWVALLVLSLCPMGAPSEDKPASAALIVNILGKLEVKSVNPGVWRVAEVNAHLLVGDRVRTGDFGKASILFTDGSMVKVGSNTELEVKLALKKGSDGSRRGAVDMAEGDIYSEVRKKDPAVNPDEFKIYTKTAVAAVKGTKLGVKSDQRQTTLLLYEGAVEFQNQFGKQMVTAKAGGQPQKSEAKIDKAPTLQVAAKDTETQKWAQGVEQAPKLRLVASVNPAASPAGLPFKVNVSVQDQSGKPVGGREDKLTVSSSSKTMVFSSDGAKWSESLMFGLRDGRGSVMAKDITMGGATISVVSTELAPDNQSVTIVPQQKTGKKELRGTIKSKDGKPFKFIGEYQKQP